MTCLDYGIAVGLLWAIQSLCKHGESLVCIATCKSDLFPIILK